MIIIRPVREPDVGKLYEISHKTGKGFTSLQPNKAFIEEKVEHAVKSFNQKPVRGKSQLYLFVAEDTETKDLIGTSGIKSAVGLNKPWYSYKINKQIHASSKLGVYNSTDILLLCNNHTGCSELCSLFLHPDYRGKMHGLPLSKSRFMFIKAHKKLFSDHVIAEMRGFIDQNNQSPFWKKFVSKFLPLSFSYADFLSTVDKSFIAELMPRHPIYTNMMDKQVQECIGVPHNDTVSAKKILEREGFVYTKYIDIFDGGPLLECETKHIESIKNTKIVTAVVKNISDKMLHHKRVVIANNKLSNFRCTFTSQVNIHLNKENIVTIDTNLAEKLLINNGDEVSIHSPV